MKNKIIIIILVILLLIIGVVVLVIFNQKILRNSMPTNDSDAEKVIAEPRELDIFVNYSENVKLFLYDSNTNKKKDITNQANWRSEDYQIAYVANQGIKGQVMARKEGYTKIIANFNGEEIEVPIKVSNNELEVVCAPLVYDKETGERNKDKETEKKANVGDKIVWMIIYEKVGAPQYFYKWSGDDNLEGEKANAEIVYETIGTKRAKIWTEDTAKLTAEAECAIEITE